MKKVVVTSLPKTGTSTLAVMLRVLDYSVTGPNNASELGKLMADHSAFQDFPWCFEYELFDPKETIFLYLQRTDEEWANSFITSYGYNGNHLCERYWPGLKSIPENKQELIQKKKAHLTKLKKWSEMTAAEIKYIDLKNLSWEILCHHLNKEVPKDLFGRQLNVPKVNTTSSRRLFRFKKLFRKLGLVFFKPDQMADMRTKFFKLLGRRL